MYKFTVRSKILAITGAGILGFLTFLLLTLHSNQLKRDLIQSVQVAELKVMDEITDLARLIRSHREIVFSIIKEKEIDRVEDVRKLDKKIIQLFDHVDSHLLNLSPLVQETKTHYAEYNDQFNQYVKALVALNSEDSGSPSLDLTQRFGAILESDLALKSSFTKLQDSFHVSLSEKLKKVDIKTHQQDRIGLVIGLVTLSIMTAVSLMIVRSLTNSVGSAVRVAGKIATGDYSQTTYQKSDDEIGEILNSLDQMRESISAHQKKLMIMSVFNDALNAESPKLSLVSANAVVRELFHLHSSALYVLDEKDHLNLLALSSIDNEVDVRKITNDFDLVSECLERKKSIVLNLPVDTGEMLVSCFAQKTPLHSVWLSPVKISDNILGVVVTGHLCEFDELDHELLNECILRVAPKIDAYRLELERLNLLSHLESRAAELELLNEENIKISNTKSEFLACMSHEIRTPIHGVMGMLDLLNRTSLTSKQKHYLDLSHNSAKSFLTVINDILDFSKIEAGHLVLEEIDFDLKKDIVSIVESHGISAQKKGLELVVDVMKLSDKHVKGDPNRIRQVLSNLIGNAIKFTENGEIVVRASLTHREADLYDFVCTVTDTGVGIDQDKAQVLFESFTQADSSTTRKFGGTGLGLAIVKKLCELMHGDVKVSSRLGNGSQFTVSLAVESSTQVCERQTVDLSQIKILVVDDNPPSRNVIVDQLQRSGAKVVSAEDGQGALALLEKNHAALEHTIDLLLIDYDMPDYNGVELAQFIRTHAQYDETKLILMASMDDQINDAHIKNQGFCNYLRKPVNPFELVEVLHELVHNSQPLALPESSDASVEPSQGAQPIRVLVVEDNPVNQEVALLFLNFLGHHSDIAHHGKEALMMLSDRLAQHPYDLILMDCQMPVMDGYETTKAIRRGEAGAYYKDIPIVAMTANAMQGDREKCLDAGMSDYLSKPVDEPRLNQMITKWTQVKSLSQTDGSSAAVESTHHTASDVEESTDGACSHEVWDRTQLLKRLHGQEDQLNKLLEMFVSQMPLKIQKLQSAIEEGNLQEIAEVAHYVKSSASNLASDDIAHTCRQIEAHAKKGNPEPLKKLVGQVSDQYAFFLRSANRDS